MGLGAVEPIPTRARILEFISERRAVMESAR
jgi:hypothetical protein